MGNKVKQVVGYGGLNYILFAIISVIFATKSNPEWHSLITVLIIMGVASTLLYLEKPMAIYIMALAMLFILITILVAGGQLILAKNSATGVTLIISWVLVIVNLVTFGLWVTSAIKYRRQAGVYFRK